jgi:hypothetical protein
MEIKWLYNILAKVTIFISEELKTGAN